MVKVAIQCLVYNHEPYIRKCLDGFLMQRTNFQFIALVHDDVSTDNSAAIIREYAEKYPSIIKPIFETENQYSKFDGSIFRIMADAIKDSGAEYTAICEGDDYWVDPEKLQKQVDILDADKSLIACVSDAQVVDSDGSLIKAKRGGVVPGDKEGKYSIRDFFTEPGHQYPTPSVVFRNAFLNQVMDKYLKTQNPHVDDWNLWICLHIFGDFYYIDQPMVAFRINPTSLTHTEDKITRAKAGPDICDAIADILPAEYSSIARKLRRKRRQKWVSLAHAYMANGMWLKMCGCIVLSIFMCPRTLLAATKQWVRLIKGERAMFEY